VHLPKLFFFFLRVYFFFQFGNYLPCPFYFCRVSFKQFWRSSGFPFLSRLKHSTFGSTKLVFSLGLFFPHRFIMFRVHIRSLLVHLRCLTYRFCHLFNLARYNQRVDTTHFHERNKPHTNSQNNLKHRVYVVSRNLEEWVAELEKS